MAFVAIFGNSAAFSQNSEVSPTAYGHLPAILDAAVSLDGRRGALLETSGDTGFVSIFDLEDGSEPIQFGVGQNKPHEFIELKGEDHWL